MGGLKKAKDYEFERKQMGEYMEGVGRRKRKGENYVYIHILISKYLRIRLSFIECLYFFSCIDLHSGINLFLLFLQV